MWNVRSPKWRTSSDSSQLDKIRRIRVWPTIGTRSFGVSATDPPPLRGYGVRPIHLSIWSAGAYRLLGYLLGLLRT